ncbi:MAG: helix-turn-helix domain-containing protein [Synergistaceae bacterium]|jgi:cytoskeletal protein RodZ|nr:helix-turn-helix domain-containing protein [Synergistaceae bacterium]
MQYIDQEQVDEGSADLKRLGVQLRSLREAQKFSLEDVSNMTHVRPHLLQAIEEGRLEKITAPVYMRGFVKTYCEYLMADDLWKRFNHLLPSPEDSGMLNTDNSNSSVDIQHPTPMFRRSSIIWVYIILVIAVLGAAYLLWNQHNDPDQTLEAFFLKQPETMSGDVEAILPVTVSADTAQTVSGELIAQPVSAEPPSQFVRVVSPEIKELAPKDVSAQSTGLTVSSFDMSWMDMPVSASARPVVELPQIQDRKLFVEITGSNNRLAVERDNKMVTRRTLGAGSRRTYDVYKDTRVTLSVGNKARITWQGKRYDSIGGDANPVSLIFRPDGSVTVEDGNVPHFAENNSQENQQ